MGTPDLPSAADQLNVIQGTGYTQPYLQSLIAALTFPEIASMAVQILEPKIITRAASNASSDSRKRLVEAANRIGVIRGEAKPKRSKEEDIANAIASELKANPGLAAELAQRLSGFLPASTESYVQDLDNLAFRLAKSSVTTGLTGGMLSSKDVAAGMELLAALQSSEAALDLIAAEVSPNLTVPAYEPITKDTPSEILGFPPYTYYVEGGGTHDSSGGKVTVLRDRVSLSFYSVPPSERIDNEGDEIYLSFDSPGSPGPVFESSSVWTCFFVGRLEPGRRHLVMGESGGDGALVVDLSTNTMEIVMSDGRVRTAFLPTSLNPQEKHIYCWQIDWGTPFGRTKFLIDGKAFYDFPTNWSNTSPPSLTLDTFLADAAGNMYTLFGFNYLLSKDQLSTIGKKVAAKYQTPWEGTEEEDWGDMPIARNQQKAYSSAVRAAFLMPEGREYLNIDRFSYMLEDGCIWLSGNPHDTQGHMYAPAGRVQYMTNTLTDVANAVTTNGYMTQESRFLSIPKKTGVWITDADLPRLMQATICVAIMPTEITDSKQNIWEMGDGAVRLELSASTDVHNLVLTVPDGEFSAATLVSSHPVEVGIPLIVTTVMSGSAVRLYVNGILQDARFVDQSFGSGANNGVFNMENRRMSMGRSTPSGSDGAIGVLSLLFSDNGGVYPMAERFLDNYHRLRLIENNSPVFPNPPQPTVVSASTDFMSMEVDLTGFNLEMSGFQTQRSEDGPRVPFSLSDSAGSNLVGDSRRYNYSGMGAGTYKTRFRLVYGVNGPYSDWMESEEVVVG